MSRIFFPQYRKGKAEHTKPNEKESEFAYLVTEKAINIFMDLYLKDIEECREKSQGREK